MNTYSIKSINKEDLIIKADKLEMRGDTIVFLKIICCEPITLTDRTEDLAYINKNFVESVIKEEGNNADRISVVFKEGQEGTSKAARCRYDSKAWPRHFQRRQGKIKAKMVFEKDSITVSPAPQIQPVSATPKQGVFKRMTSWISRKRG